MGTCSVQKKQPIYINHSKQDVDKHFIAIIKLEHIDKRQVTLKQQALDDVNRIVSASLELIKIQQEFVLKSFENEIKQIQQNKEQMHKLAKCNMFTEQFIGKVDTQQNIQTYKLEVQQKFQQIKKELEENMNMTFQNLKKDLQSKKIQFQETEDLSKEDLNATFQKWRSRNRNLVKLAIIEIENRFKDELNHDYFRNKLKKVVTAEEVKRTIVRCRPRTLPQKTEVVVIEEVNYVKAIEATVDPGKELLCCLPSMRTK